MSKLSLYNLMKFLNRNDANDVIRRRYVAFRSITCDGFWRHDFEIGDTGLIKIAPLIIQASSLFSTFTEYQLRNIVLYIQL